MCSLKLRARSMSYIADPLPSVKTKEFTRSLSKANTTKSSAISLKLYAGFKSGSEDSNQLICHGTTVTSSAFTSSKADYS